MIQEIESHNSEPQRNVNPEQPQAANAEMRTERPSTEDNLWNYEDYERQAINLVYGLIDTQLKAQTKLLEDSSQSNQQYWLVIRESLRKAGKNAAIQITDIHGRAVMDSEIRISAIQEEIKNLKQKKEIKADDPTLVNLNKEMMRLTGERDRMKIEFEQKLRGSVGNLVDILKLIAIKSPFHNRLQLNLEEISYLEARDGEIGLFVGQVDANLMNIIRQMVANPAAPINYTSLIQTLYGQNADFESILTRTNRNAANVEKTFADLAGAVFILENLNERQRKELSGQLVGELGALQHNPADNGQSVRYHEFLRSLLNPQNPLADSLKRLDEIQNKILQIKAAGSLNAAADMENFGNLPSYKEYTEREAVISEFQGTEANTAYQTVQNQELALYRQITLESYNQSQTERQTGNTHGAHEEYNAKLKELQARRKSQEEIYAQTEAELKKNTEELEMFDDDFDATFARIMAEFEKDSDGAFKKYGSDSLLAPLKNQESQEKQETALREWMRFRKELLVSQEEHLEEILKKQEEEMIIVAREIRSENPADDKYSKYVEMQKHAQETELAGFRKVQDVNDALSGIREEIIEAVKKGLSEYDVIKSEHYKKLSLRYSDGFTQLGQDLETYAKNYLDYILKQKARTQLITEAEDYLYASERMKGSVNTLALPEARDILYWEIKDHEKYKQFREELINGYVTLREAYKQKKDIKEINEINGKINEIKIKLTGTISAKRQSEFKEKLLTPWCKRMEALAVSGGPITEAEIRQYKEAVDTNIFTPEAEKVRKSLQDDLVELFEETTLEKLEKQIEEAKEKLKEIKGKNGVDSMEYLDAAFKLTLLEYRYKLYEEYGEGIAWYEFLNNGNLDPAQSLELNNLEMEAGSLRQSIQLTDQAFEYQKSENFRRESKYLMALENLLPFLSQAQREAVLRYAKEKNVNLAHITVDKNGRQSRVDVVNIEERIRSRHYSAVQEKMAQTVAESHEKVVRGNNLNPVIRAFELKNLLAIGAVGVSAVTIILNLWVNRGNLSSLPGNMCLWGAGIIGGTATYAYGRTGGDVGDIVNQLKRGPGKKQQESLTEADKQQDFLDVYNEYPALGNLFMDNLTEISRDVNERIAKQKTAGEFEINLETDIPANVLKNIRVKYQGLDDERIKDIFTEMYKYLVVERHLEQLPQELFAFRKNLKTKFDLI